MNLIIQVRIRYERVRKQCLCSSERKKNGKSSKDLFQSLRVRDETVEWEVRKKAKEKKLRKKNSMSKLMKIMLPETEISLTLFSLFVSHSVFFFFSSPEEKTLLPASDTPFFFSPSLFSI